jgi:hypothetical protein
MGMALFICQIIWVRYGKKSEKLLNSNESSTPGVQNSDSWRT